MSTSILTLNHAEFITKLLSLEASKGAKMLLMALKVDDGKTAITTRILAEKLRCSPRSVQRYLKELVEKGLCGAPRNASAQKTTLILDPSPASGRRVDMINASSTKPTLEQYIEIEAQKFIQDKKKNRWLHMFTLDEVMAMAESVREPIDPSTTPPPIKKLNITNSQQLHTVLDSTRVLRGLLERDYQKLVAVQRPSS